MLSALEILLEDEGYDVTTASSGMEAIEKAKGANFDLVVSDVRMAEMDGIETLSNVKQQQPDARSIVITGYASPDIPVQAIKLGVDDYIMKPFDDRQFVASVKRCLESFRLQKAYATGLGNQWKDFSSIIKLLAEGVEEKDPHFAGHSRRVAETSVKIGKRAGLAREQLEILELAAFMHDIGTIGRKRSFLDKASELVEAEKQELAERQTAASQSLFSSSSSLKEVFRVILHHHEWFDGSGLPDGLAGEAIPLESRILCVVEAYDAMISPRPHRPPMSHNEARLVMQKESGSHFDPRIVKLLEEVQSEGDEEEEEVNEAEVFSRERQAELMLGLAGTYLSAGDLETAGKGYEELLSLFPQGGKSRIMTEALTGLALSLVHRRRTEEARTAVERAWNDYPGESGLLRGRVARVRGLVSGLQGETEAGLSDLDTADEQFRKWEAHGDRAINLLYRGRLLRLAEKPAESVAATLESAQLIDGLELASVLKGERHLAIPLLLEASAAAAGDTTVVDRLLLNFGWDIVSGFQTEVSEAARQKARELFSSREAVAAAPPLSLYAFGKFRVFSGGNEVHDKLWKTRKSKYIFAYLATQAGKDVGDEKIMDTFWPDNPPEKARQSLYAALSHMRKALESGGEAGEQERVVLARKGFYKFNEDRPWFFDVMEFEKLYDQGQARLRDGREDEAVSAFQKAEALYQGPFMEGYYADWAVYLKENLEIKFTEILETMMEHFFDKQRYEVACDYANRLLQIDNCHQEAHITLMTSYVEQGKPAQAIRQYQACSQVFKDELNLSPPSEMAEMYLEITA
jgi:response regulator RpfG family c-di-GMP phosphodiesterase/DNA-binding SARP family transcriptional activator